MSDIRAELPQAVRPAAPSPAPEFPREFGEFAPPEDEGGAVPANAPALAEWNRVAGPGDVLTVTGSRLTSLSGSALGSDTAFTVFGQAGRKQVRAEAAIHRLAGDHAAIGLPAALPARSLYLVWPRNDAGYGLPVRINATDAWWLGPDLATRGETISVYGRNLTPVATERRSWIFLQPTSGVGRWLKARTANPYRADFLLPDDLPNGEYTVWAHNGLGRALGWAVPLKLTIDDGLPWTGPELNVQTFGAKGDGATDDLAAISQALDAAESTPGSTVYFPPGTYAISDSIVRIPERTRLRGAGMDRTRIRPTADYAGTNNGLIFAVLKRVEIRDLTFDTAGVLDGALGNNLLYLRQSSRVVLDRVRLTQEKDTTTSDGAPIDLHFSDHVLLRGCDIRASGGVFLGTCRQVFFESCRFRGLNDLGAFIYLWGGNGVSVSGCTAADFDSRDPNDGHGWAQGRFLSGQGNWGACRNVYFGKNQTKALTVRPTYSEQNTGEQFLFEGLETLIRGTPDSSGLDWVQFDDFTDDYTGQMLVVIAGAGLGQCRQIESFNAMLGRITVNVPWTVTPDATSTIVVGHYISRMAVYGNGLSGKPRAVAAESHVAATGIEPFGGCVEFVAAGNTMRRLRYGISNWSNTNKFGSEQVLQPNFFNEFLGNRIVGCRFGIAHWLRHLEPDLPTIADTGMLGNLFRDNRISGTKEAAITYETHHGFPGVQMMVFDRNAGALASPAVINDTGELRDQVWSRNRFSGRGAGLSLDAAHRPALHENKWGGFKPVYGGAPPGPLLEVPQRRIAVSAAAGKTARGEITIWNAGTSALEWSATSDAPWLKLKTASGTITGERTPGKLAFTAESEGLPAGDAQAIVTLTAGTQEQQVRVTFAVAP